jgi:hypothetical protein
MTLLLSWISSTWYWITDPITWRKYNPFQLSYKTFMKTLRDPSIPIMNRKDFFFKNSEPYLDHFNKKEYQRDFLFVSTLLSSSVQVDKTILENDESNEKIYIGVL